MKKKIQTTLKEQADLDKDLFALLGLTGLTLEEQEALLASFADIVFQNVFTESIPLLSEEKLEEFNKLTSGKNNEDAILAFLETNVPEFEEIVTREIESFQNSLRRMMPPLTEEEKAYLS